RLLHLKPQRLRPCDHHEVTCNEILRLLMSETTADVKQKTENEQVKKRRRKRDIIESSDRPPTLKVNPDGIPAELKTRRQWVAWKWRREVGKRNKAGRWTKVPINARTGHLAKSNDQSTWSTFQEAIAYYKTGKADGVGYVFTEKDPFCGIDLDDCRDP